MIPGRPKVYKSHGGLEEFSKEKLLRSLQRTGLPAEQSNYITNKVASSVYEGQKTRDIYRKALRLVKETSPRAAAQYSLKRAIFDLGPSGHNFETFVAKFFQYKGYRTSTCQIIKGRWVNHEVDVVAEKNDEVKMVECKFHNRFGLKNDIKVALYVKARRDDIKEGPEGGKLKTFCLASNTAFTKDAIIYAKGTGIVLLGVNAPEEKSFLEEIKELRLFPVTSLRSVRGHVKKALLAKNVVTIQDLKHQQELLHSLGMKQDEIQHVFNEIKLLGNEST